MSDGLCQCGCGRKTLVPKRNETAKNWRKGVPMPFVPGHQNRLAAPYAVEERGHDSPCWVWNGRRNNGYGRIMEAGGEHHAHRIFWERVNGPVPPGLDLDHLCRNRACVNPDHLEPVSRRENLRRGSGTKLTKVEAQEIVGSAERGVDLAARYGVSQTTICAIRKGTNWRDLERGER